MKKLSVFFESPSGRDTLSIKRYLRNNVPVWIVEPFHAYHHKKGIRFFLPKFPDFVNNLIKNKKINVLKTEQLNAKEIYMLAADKAVNVVESVFPEYRKEHEELFQYVSDTLKSPIAENVFKKNLCERLAEFYSVNILLYRTGKLLGPVPILFYPDTNVLSYLHIKELLLKSNQEVFEHTNTSFPIRMYVVAFFENLKKTIFAIFRLSAQTIVSGIMNIFPTAREKKKRSYLYGVTIISPSRQLRGNKRGPNFIIDNKRIMKNDVVLFPLTDLTSDQENELVEMYGEAHVAPKAGRFFSHSKEWKKLLWLSIKKKFLRNGEEVYVACVAFSTYFTWLKIMEEISIKHFITHCEFGIGHVGRNIVLNQAGVQTWYFTDSMNFGCNMKDGKEKCSRLHPFWTYLNYDHFVTWDNFLVQYFKDHPESFRQFHVVGCLWSGHIREKNKTREQLSNFTLMNKENSFIIAAFDSTYSRNGITSYIEGIEFAKHLLKLADTFYDIIIFLKEKKDRSLHNILDPDNSPELVTVYKSMNSHPQITMISDMADMIIGRNVKSINNSTKIDASELISASDMVVSFPFTSTTFEALSINKPSIWHDPMGYYKNTPYGKIKGVTTHSYEELKAKVLEIKSLETDTYQNIPMNSPLMDPYRDGKAIDRFRDLLTTL